MQQVKNPAVGAGLERRYTVKCPKCEAENDGAANFCRNCGTKLREICDCWVKKEPYNCGQGKCPGYRLFLVEKLKARGAASDSHIHIQEGTGADLPRQSCQEI